MEMCALFPHKIFLLLTQNAKHNKWNTIKAVAKKERKNFRFLANAIMLKMGKLELIISGFKDFHHTNEIRHFTKLQLIDLWMCIVKRWSEENWLNWLNWYNLRRNLKDGTWALCSAVFCQQFSQFFIIYYFKLLCWQECWQNCISTSNWNENLWPLNLWILVLWLRNSIKVMPVAKSNDFKARITTL